MNKKLSFAASLFVLFMLLAGCTAPGFNGTTILSTVDIATPQPVAATQTDQPAPVQTETTAPAEEESGWVALVGEDGNVWMLDRADGNSIQITTDAVLMTAESTAEPVRYCCLDWSSDGQLLSYMREQSVVANGGYNYQYSFMIFDAASQTSRMILEGQPTVGYTWKPGTHLIAYGQPVDTRYWTSREAVPSEYAQGIWQVDADTGETDELVPAERGYTLVMPAWSGDGRYLAFEEIRLMEGRGEFAYFDAKTGQYNALEKKLGSYSWAPDGNRLAYDQIDYIPQGGERIWLNTPDGAQGSGFSPAFDDTWFAFAPAFSPDGSKVAYLVYQNDRIDQVDQVGQGSTVDPSIPAGQDNSNIFHLYVQNINSQEPRDYGAFEQVQKLRWTSDNRYVVFSTGPFDQKSVVEVNVESGDIRRLGLGSEAAPQP